MKRGRGSDTAELVDIEVVEIRARTDAAILVVITDDDEVWLPLSQIEIDDDGSCPVITMPYWLAETKGLV